MSWKICVKNLVGLLALSVALSMGAACGGDDNSAPQEGEVEENQGGSENGASNGDDGGNSNGDDGGSSNGGNGVDGGDSCGFNYTIVQGEIADWGASIYLVNNAPGELSQIILLFDETKGGPDGPGTYDLSATDISDCSTCFVYAEYNNATGQLEALFAPESGRLVIEEYDGRGPFKATLEEVELVEIEYISDSNTAPVPNGQTRCVDGFTFEILMHGGGFEELVCTGQEAQYDFDAESVEGLFDEGYFQVRASTSADPQTGYFDFLNVVLGVEYVYGEEYKEGDRIEIVDFNLGTCLECVALLEGCGPDGMCTARYNAGAGEVIIEQLDRDNGELKLVLRNLQLVQTYDDEDQHSVIAANGIGWCMDEMVLETTF